MLHSKQLSNSTMTKQELQHLVDFHRSVMPLVLADIEREARGVRLIYALDFCEIYNYIFSTFRQTETAIEYYLKNMNHPMILLPPTILEMLRNFETSSIWYRKVYHPKANAIDQFLDSKEVHELLRKAEQADTLDHFRALWDDYSKLERKYRLILGFLLDDATLEIWGLPGEMLKQLLQEGNLRLADEMELERITWEEFDDEIFAEAYRLFRRVRPSLSKRFANRVDALNIAIIFALNRKYSFESGEVYFSLVTHGPYTEQIWSSLRWNEDPWIREISPLVGLDVIPLTRKPHHCAYHAYFDKKPDPLQAARSHLVELKEAKELLDRKTLAKLCRDIDEVIGRGPPPLRLKETFLQRQSRAEVEHLLKRRTGRFQQSIIKAYKLVETSLSNYPLEIIDHDSEEFIRSILDPSSRSARPLEPDPKKPKLIARTRLPKDAEEKLYIGKEYQLELQIYLRSPEDVPDNMGSLDETIHFEVVVHAEDMEVIPHRFVGYTLDPEKASDWLSFTLIPQRAGREKRICVLIYHERYFINMLEYERDVIGEPTASEQQIARLVRPLTISDKELHLSSKHTKQPVQVRLEFSYSHEKKRYIMNVSWEGPPRSILTSISEGDLVAINDRMQNRIGQIVKAHSGKQMPDDAKLERLDRLTEEGLYAYKRLFPRPEDQEFIQHVLARGKPPITIGVTSIEPLFPLELLYDCSMEEEPDYEHFWGMRYIIWRDIVSHEARTLAPEIPIKPMPRVALLPNMALRHVRNIEVLFFHAKQRTRKLILSHWPSPSTKGERKEKLSFRNFLSTEFEIVHFACHVATESEGDSASTYIELSNQFRVSVRDLVIYNVHMRNNPVIVLNACRTSVVNPLSTSNLATAIQEHGGRGVIATECQVPDAFGADFTTELYYHLIDERKELGKSLLEVRRYFLREQNNPAGLLYTLYGNPGIKLVEQ